MWARSLLVSNRWHKLYRMDGHTLVANPVSTNTIGTHFSLHSIDMYKGLLCTEPSSGSFFSEKVRVGLASPGKTNPTSYSRVASMDNLALSITDNIACRCTREAMSNPQIEISSWIFFSCFSIASSSNYFSFYFSTSLSFPEASAWSKCGGLKYRSLLVIWSISSAYHVLFGRDPPQSSSVWARSKLSSSYNTPSAIDKQLSGSVLIILTSKVSPTGCWAFPASCLS